MFQLMNEFFSPFVFSTFSSPHLFLPGVTTGQGGKYFSVSCSLMSSQCTSILTLNLNPLPHICPILNVSVCLWVCLCAAKVRALRFPQIAHQCFFSNDHPIVKCIWNHEVSSQKNVFGFFFFSFYKYISHFCALNLHNLTIHSGNLDNYYMSIMSLNQVFSCVFKSYGDHTAGEVWWVWLHLHRSKVSDPNSTVQCRFTIQEQTRVWCWNWSALFLQGVLQRPEVVTQQHPVSPWLQPVYW